MLKEPLGETKVWGWVKILHQTETSLVNLLHCSTGFVCSHHWHKWRANRFFLINGTARISLYDRWASLDGNQFDAMEWSKATPPDGDMKLRQVGYIDVPAGKMFDVPSRVVHRFEILEEADMVEIYWSDRPEGMVWHDDICRLTVGHKLEEHDGSELVQLKKRIEIPV